MNRFYVIYLSLREDGNVIFSSPFSTFNKAKENIDAFLENYANKIGKKTLSISKDDFEKLKINKNPDDVIFVRRKNSDASLYYRITLTGTFYNSFIIEKYGKIGINEFSFSISNTVNNSVKNTGSNTLCNTLSGSVDKDEICYKVDEKKDDGIEKMSHGVHVNLISELKSVLAKRIVINNVINNVKENKSEKKVNEDHIGKESKAFVSSLIERKSTLRNITPPPPRKLII